MVADNKLTNTGNPTSKYNIIRETLDRKGHIKLHFE